jgi:SAM-dependent methyltransferase
MDPDPLARTRRVYGDRLEASLPGRVFVDIGCGLGAQVIAAAEAGARLAVGVDKTAINLAIGSANAQQRGVTDRVHFTTDAVSTLGTEWADVVLSQNSFEHFEKPESILGQAHAVLKPGGQFFVTFGPSWWHPYGVHHMFMIRLPWAHGVFSERTILRVRQLYRPDKPSCWREVSLNQMTIRKLLRLVEASGFSLTYFDVTPIRPVPKRIARVKSFREWTTADVSVILTKPVP